MSKQLDVKNFEHFSNVTRLASAHNKHLEMVSECVGEGFITYFKVYEAHECVHEHILLINAIDVYNEIEE